uniref:ArsR/SmtB family transcription factor n=1 Tax=Halopseudomonas xiamenensis TaxID=157792 RepID=UPI001627DD18|nr:metalloregulator ArsR/SmtB family transcription factor [Halopseudomonas xiamenensis]
MSLSEKDAEFFAQGVARATALLRTVGNERRLLVLCLLAGHGEMTVGDMLGQIDLSQSALSQHLAKMREEGVVSYRREAQTLYYRIADPNVERLLALLKDMYCP